MMLLARAGRLCQMQAEYLCNKLGPYRALGCGSSHSCWDARCHRAWRHGDQALQLDILVLLVAAVGALTLREVVLHQLQDRAWLHMAWLAMLQVWEVLKLALVTPDVSLSA
jgi:hypothetical protein